MDLRRRLLGWLGLLLGCLLAAAAAVQFASLRADIATEIAASSRLVGLLTLIDGEPALNRAALAERLATTPLRHLRISLEAPTPLPPPAWPLRWLGLSTADLAPQKIRIGSQELYISANPASEVEERLADTAHLLITLLLYSGATLLAAWWATDRALRPVRELESGLQRLADGEPDPALPSFALSEFRRVATAIEGLGQSLAAARGAQKALARQLLRVQEDERRHLAHELHDEMGQTLTALNTTTAYLERHGGQLAPPQLAECCADLRRDVRGIGGQLRAMLKSLRPHGLNAEALPGALRELVDGWQTRGTGIEFALELPAAFPEVDERAALTLYRVVQEALTNVVRHSGARRCAVHIGSDGGWLRASIVDDGEGLPSSGPARRGGLLGMAERLEMAGGALNIENPPGGGLRLSATLPCCNGGNEEEETR